MGISGIFGGALFKNSCYKINRGIVKMNQPDLESGYTHAFILGPTSI